MNIPRLVFRLLLGKRLPTTGGNLRVPGAHGPVTIRRDAYGVPHIEAQEEWDAWYGLGFCQSQDRAFALESMLRVARGTLAERVGAEALAVDRLSRRIGFARSAEQQLETLSPDVRLVLDAFAKGVNDGAKFGSRRRPHEFAILMSRPTQYEASDPIAISKLLCFSMASNWDSELARLKIAREDGDDALIALDPTYPEWPPVSHVHDAPSAPVVDRLAQDLKAWGDTIGAGGSNNWAIGATRTASGRPILACDPHLPPQLPPIWYLAHIRTPDWSVAGATFAGTPGFVMGHNGHAAWAPTAGLVDNTDLYVEEVARTAAPYERTAAS